MLSAHLRELAIPCLSWPLTRIVPMMESLEVPPTVDALLATSAHGLRAFAALSPRRDLAVLAVGDATAETARGLGFGFVFSAGRDARALAGLAVASGLRHFLYPRGREVASDLTGVLEAEGRRVTERVVYAAEPAGPPPSDVAHALAAGRVGLATVWSARGAEILAPHLAALSDPPRVLAISARAARPLAEAGLEDIVQAERPDQPAMLAAIVAQATSGPSRRAEDERP